MSAVYTAIRQNSAAYSPLFDKCQRYTPRYSTRSTCTAIYIQRVLAYTASRHVSPTNLRFSFGSCRFRCIIFVLLLTCLAAFALTLLVCFVCFPPKKKRPHAPGTHATRRNIAVNIAIPLAFNKRLQQHMRSTTLQSLRPTPMLSLDAHREGQARDLPASCTAYTPRARPT